MKVEIATPISAYRTRRSVSVPRRPPTHTASHRGRDRPVDEPYPEGSSEAPAFGAPRRFEVAGRVDVRGGVLRDLDRLHPLGVSFGERAGAHVARERADTGPDLAREEGGSGSVSEREPDDPRSTCLERLDERPNVTWGDAGLVGQQDDSRLRPSAGGAQARCERARQPRRGCRVLDGSTLRRERHRGTHGVRVVPEDDDDLRDLGIRQRVDRALDQRHAGDPFGQLRTAEPRRGPGSEDDAGDPRHGGGPPSPSRRTGARGTGRWTGRSPTARAPGRRSPWPA